LECGYIYDLYQTSSFQYDKVGKSWFDIERYMFLFLLS
jgi:hypothetical protein